MAWPDYPVTHYTQFMLSQIPVRPATNGPYVDHRSRTPLDTGDFDGNPTYWFMCCAVNRGLSQAADIKLVDFDNPNTVFATVTVPDSGNAFEDPFGVDSLNEYDEKITLYKVQFTPGDGNVNYAVQMPNGYRPLASVYGVYAENLKIAVFQTNPTKSVVEKEIWVKPYDSSGVKNGLDSWGYFGAPGEFYYGKYFPRYAAYNEWAATNYDEWWQHYYELGGNSGIAFKYEAAAYQEIRDITIDLCGHMSSDSPVVPPIKLKVCLAKYPGGWKSSHPDSDVEYGYGILIPETEVSVDLDPQPQGTPVEDYYINVWNSVTFSPAVLEDGMHYTTVVANENQAFWVPFVERMRMRIRLQNLTKMRVSIPLSSIYDYAPGYNMVTHRYLHPDMEVAAARLRQFGMSWNVSDPDYTSRLRDVGVDDQTDIDWPDYDQIPMGDPVAGSDVTVSHYEWGWNEIDDPLGNLKLWSSQEIALTKGNRYLMYYASGYTQLNNISALMTFLELDFPYVSPLPPVAIENDFMVNADLVETHFVFDPGSGCIPRPIGCQPLSELSMLTKPESVLTMEATPESTLAQEDIPMSALECE